MNDKKPAVDSNVPDASQASGPGETARSTIEKALEISKLYDATKVNLDAANALKAMPHFDLGILPDLKLSTFADLYRPPKLSNALNWASASGWVQRNKKLVEEFIAESDEMKKPFRIIYLLPNNLQIVPASLGYFNPDIVTVWGQISIDGRAQAAQVSVHPSHLQLIMYTHDDHDAPRQEVLFPDDEDEDEDDDEEAEDEGP
jgi:hypothetical protein